MAIDNSGAPGNYGSKKSSEYRGSASGTAAKKKAATKSKTVATSGTKVSSSTIEKIKAMGMTKALKSAGSASPEMREGIKRMYGASRFNAAVSSTKPYASKPVAKSADAARAAATKGATYKSADSARSAASKPAKPVAKSADAARSAAVARGVNTSARGGTAKQTLDAMKKPVAKPVAKPAAKKSETTDPFARFVFGAIKSVRGGSNQGMTAAQVAAENKRRIAAAKKNK